jgi:hypothetical protein
MIEDYDLLKKNIKIGFINREGKELISPEFDFCSNFYGSYANVVKDSVWGIIDGQGHATYFPGYDKVYFFYPEAGIAKKAKKMGLIGRDGTLVSELIYDQILVSYDPYYKVKLNGAWRVINERAESVLPSSIELEGTIVYNSTTSFVKKIEGKRKKGMINMKGEVVIPALFDELTGSFSEGLMRVVRDQKVGFVDKAGNEVIPLEYEDVGYTFYEQKVRAKKNGKWGFINTSNEVVVDFIYDQVGEFSEGLAMVLSNRKAGYVDPNGVVKIPLQLDFISANKFNDGLAVYLNEDQKFGYMDTSGDVEIAPLFDSAEPFSKGKAHVGLNGKSTIINTKGEFVLPLTYRAVWASDNNYLRFVR